MQIGLIGLGVMGRDLSLNMADHGFSVAGYDKDPGKVEALNQESEAQPSSTMLWLRRHSGQGLQAIQIWRRNHEQTNTCQPPDLQSSTHGSRGIRFPGGACPGYALVVESCRRRSVAAA